MSDVEKDNMPDVIWAGRYDDDGELPSINEWRDRKMTGATRYIRAIHAPADAYMTKALEAFESMLVDERNERGAMVDGLEDCRLSEDEEIVYRALTVHLSDDGAKENSANQQIADMLLSWMQKRNLIDRGVSYNAEELKVILNDHEDALCQPPAIRDESRKAALEELPGKDDFAKHVGHESADYLYVYGDTIRAALLKEPKPGYVMVPVEPTENMIQAGHSSEVLEEIRNPNKAASLVVYKAMIAAAQESEG